MAEPVSARATSGSAGDAGGASDGSPASTSDDPDASPQGVGADRWHVEPPKPLSGLRVLRVTVLVVVTALVLLAPLWHYLDWSDHREARKCAATGHVVTVRNPSDVRVDTEQEKYTVSVVSVSVRVNGEWREIRDSGQFQPNDVPQWYAPDGTFAPLKGTSQYPPLTVRDCPDPNGVMLESDLQNALKGSGNDLSDWLLDAAALVVAAVLLRRARRWWRRGLQVQS